MGNKKGAQTKTESTTTASPEAMAAYREILARATKAADTPYTAYTGDRVAGFSPDQMAAFQATRDAQGVASPFLTEATGMARTGAAPIDAAAIERYRNPYESSVIDATIADLQTQNAIAQQQVTGNAALRGALGGSRVGVAQALTAGEQARSQNPLIANMRASGYDKALAAAQQDRAASSSGASLMAGLGDASSTAAYRDVASLYGMGQQQQGNDQAKLDAAYQAWVQEQAYPTQQISWLSDVASRAGGAMGSSTSGTSTAPAPNPMNAILGAVGTVAGAAIGGPMGASIGGSLGSSLGGTMGGGNKSLADGGVVPSYAAGGVVKGYYTGGGVPPPPDYVDNDPANPLIDLSLDNSGSYSMGGTEGLPTEMAGTEGTPSGGFNWQSLGNPLMHAGLKMMSSTSPYLGVAIGEGGQAGLKAYGDNAKADEAKKHREAQLQLQRDRLGASMKAQREKLDQEKWHYLGQSSDPDRPGSVFMERGTRTVEIDPTGVAPRAGAAGGRPPVWEMKRKAWLALHDGDEAGALRYASGTREMTDAEALKFAEDKAMRAADSGSMRGERRAEFIRNEVSRLMGGFRAAGVRPASPPPTPPPATEEVEGLGRRFGAPAAAARTGAMPPPRPSDVPAAPGPLPREAPPFPPGMSPTAPPPVSSMPVPRGPTPLPVSVPRPAGMSNEQLKASATTRIEKARAAGRTDEVNAILRQLREWGVTP